MSSIYERRDNGDGSYSTNTAITDSDAVIPMYVEYRKQKNEQVISGAVTAANGTASSAFIYVKDFDKIAYRGSSSAALSWEIVLTWSEDGVNTSGIDYNGASSVNHKTGIVETKAPWVKLGIRNADGTSPQTFNGYTLLKA
jgi:hypothetical protein